MTKSTSEQELWGVRQIPLECDRNMASALTMFLTVDGHNLQIPAQKDINKEI